MFFPFVYLATSSQNEKYFILPNGFIFSTFLNASFKKYEKKILLSIRHVFDMEHYISSIKWVHSNLSTRDVSNHNLSNFFRELFSS